MNGIFRIFAIWVIFVSAIEGNGVLSASIFMILIVSIISE